MECMAVISLARSPLEHAEEPHAAIQEVATEADADAVAQKQSLLYGSPQCTGTRQVSKCPREIQGTGGRSFACGRVSSDSF